MTLERGSACKNNHFRYSRKTEEYCADFFLISRRTLLPTEWALFKLHFLEGDDYKLCCPRLRMDRGSFFHAVYRIEHKLGRAFIETEPYPLFPLSSYFSSEAIGGTVTVFPKRGQRDPWQVAA